VRSATAFDDLASLRDPGCEQPGPPGDISRIDRDTRPAAYQKRMIMSIPKVN
jgi:hypothetical protein